MEGSNKMLEFSFKGLKYKANQNSTSITVYQGNKEVNYHQSSNTIYSKNFLKNQVYFFVGNTILKSIIPQV